MWPVSKGRVETFVTCSIIWEQNIAYKFEYVFADNTDLGNRSEYLETYRYQEKRHCVTDLLSFFLNVYFKVAMLDYYYIWVSIERL